MYVMVFSQRMAVRAVWGPGIWDDWRVDPTLLPEHVVRLLPLLPGYFKIGVVFGRFSFVLLDWRPRAAGFLPAAARGRLLLSC